MKEGFFVMLCHPNGDRPVPLVKGDDAPGGASETPLVFATSREAHAAARENIIGKSNGYCVYPWPGELQ